MKPVVVALPLHASGHSRDQYIPPSGFFRAAGKTAFTPFCSILELLFN